MDSDSIVAPSSMVMEAEAVRSDLVLKLGLPLLDMRYWDHTHQSEGKSGVKLKIPRFSRGIKPSIRY